MALLEVHGLVKYYGRRCVVNGVEFSVNAGEVVGLLGPNGAGKTTSFRMATGQLTPNSGAVHFADQEVTHLPMYLRARLGMGYLAQEPSVFKKLTVEENILGILEMLPRSRTLGRPFTRAERYDRMERVVQQFGLGKVRKNLGARLSGGEKRRLEIARCLVCEPLLVLLDEPFAAVDPLTKADIRMIVKEMADTGIGVLLTDHDVREVLKITTRSYLIKDGKVRTHGTPQEIVRDPIAIKEYLGEDFHAEPFSASSPSVRPSDAPDAEPAVSASEAGGVAFSGFSNAAAAPPTLDFGRANAKVSAAQLALEQERIAQYIEMLRTPDQGHALAELAKTGVPAIPALLTALERRDVDLRQVVVELLKIITGRPISFDPFAPEAVRRQQLAMLRDQFERKAG